MSQQPDPEKLSDDQSAADETKAKFQVKFEQGDAENPKNFSSLFKAWLTAQLSLLAFCSSLGASIISPAENVLSSYLGVSLEITVLVVSLFVLGFAFGPIAWGPISETYGRRWSILPSIFILGLFSIGTAVSKNAVSVFITRFFAGLFGSSYLSNISAALGDIYEPGARGVPMALMAAAVVGGPCIAPIVGSAIMINPSLGWRWTEYIEAIIVFVITGTSLFCLPETYAPVLLQRRARKLRTDTGDDRYWHPHESQKITISNVFTKHLSRPIRMLFTEPMVICMAIYVSFAYGLLFFTLEAFPLVFADARGWGPVSSTLPFLGLFTGVLLAIGINVANQPRYKRAVAANNGKAVPEARLPPMIIGGLFFSLGLFWFGWTADPQYHWALPVVAAGFIGAGFNIVFQQGLNYLVDCYGLYAASALSANGLLRSLMACGLPLAARPLFLNLGFGPGASILGGVSCLALPIPIVFMRYGAKLRQASRYAPEDS